MNFSLLPRRRSRGEHARNSRHPQSHPDETVIFRIPSFDGGPGAVGTIPAPPAPEVAHDDRIPTRWDTSPAAVRQVRDALRVATPPAPPLKRRGIRPLPPLPPLNLFRRLPAPQAAAMTAAIRYPACDGTSAAVAPGYAAAMRHASRITGTSSPLEDTRAWPRHALGAEDTAEWDWDALEAAEAEIAARREAP